MEARQTKGQNYKNVDFFESLLYRVASFGHLIAI